MTHGVTSMPAGMGAAIGAMTWLPAKGTPVVAAGQGVSPGRKQKRTAS